MKVLGLPSRKTSLGFAGAGTVVPRGSEAFIRSRGMIAQYIDIGPYVAAEHHPPKLKNGYRRDVYPGRMLAPLRSRTHRNETRLRHGITQLPLSTSATENFAAFVPPTSLKLFLSKPG